MKHSGSNTKKKQNLEKAANVRAEIYQIGINPLHLDRIICELDLNKLEAICWSPYPVSVDSVFEDHSTVFSVRADQYAILGFDPNLLKIDSGYLFLLEVELEVLGQAQVQTSGFLIVREICDCVNVVQHENVSVIELMHECRVDREPGKRIERGDFLRAKRPEVVCVAASQTRINLDLDCSFDSLLLIPSNQATFRENYAVLVLQ